MASFKIHEDQENTATAARKDAEVFKTAAQRRALGDLSHFACNQNRTTKMVTQAHVKPTDENKYIQQIHSEKNLVPPVAQFQAFSVYEDKPTESVPKKEISSKPFSLVDLRKTTEVAKAETSKAIVKPCKLPEPVAVEPPQIKSEAKCVEPEPESPMSVTHNSTVLSMMSISHNDSQLPDTEEEEEEEEKTVAQTGREMFFHVTEYKDDIYQYMRAIEVKHRPHPRYMRKQQDITHTMRSILVDWLCEVCEEYSQQSETLHLAVSYVDRFLSYMSVVRNKLQLVGTAATFIAAKYEEVYPPEVGEFSYITDNTYTKREVLRMEHLILKILSFDLSTPTSLSFLYYYCISNGLPKKMCNLASYIAEMSLLEAEPYLMFKPSMIAAAALATARHCLLCRTCGRDEADGPRDECLSLAWPGALVQSSGYEVTDLLACMQELSHTHRQAAAQPRRAIPDKYKSSRLDSVSTIPARPLFPAPPAPLEPSEPPPAPAPPLPTAQPQPVS